MKRICLAIFLMLASVCVPASVYVIHDTEESSVRSFTFQLSKKLPVNTDILPVRYTFFEALFSYLTKNDVMVTIGLDSFREACLSASGGVIIGMFIGKEEYLHLQSQCVVPTTAIFSGGPLDKRLNLLKHIWFDTKPLSVIYSDHLQMDKVAMMEDAAQYGFELQFLETKTDRVSVLKSVNFALENSEIIFSLVDSEMYRHGVVQDVLRLLFHKQQVMIGPSAAFVRAGSLLAIYSTSEEKLSTLAEYVEEWQRSGLLKEAAYPDSLSVRFNPYLIKSHGIVLPSASYLKDQYDLCSDKQC